MNAFLRKVATVCVAFLLCASMGTIAFANDLPIYSEWAKAEVSAAENEGCYRLKCMMIAGERCIETGQQHFLSNS